MKITWENVSNPPKIKLDKSDSHLYTIVMVDHDNKEPLYLHMWYQNVSGQEEQGDVVTRYTPPKPPGGERHHYEILVFDQLGERKNQRTMDSGPNFSLEKIGLEKGILIAKKMCESDGENLYNCKQTL